MNQHVGTTGHNSAPDTDSHQVTADSLAFAIKALEQRALTIDELQAEVKRLKATIARHQRKLP